MKISDINLVADINGGADNRQLLPSIGRSSRISALASIRWQSAYATHIDSRFFDMLNVWRDFFPAEIEAQLGGLAVGDSISQHYTAGEILPEFSRSAVHCVKPQQFRRDFAADILIEPRLGRFYPGGVFENIPGNYSSNYQPCRIIDLDDNAITTDFNHPLAAHDLDVELRITGIWEGGQERGGRCNDIIDTLCADGPGMQARHQHRATNFFNDDAFARDDESPDHAFYSGPRLIEHVDKSCSLQIGELYKRLLPHQGRLLDLMSSRDSHLPAGFSTARISGLGMNQEELAQNPLLADTCVHDLNQRPQLPFEDACFDGIVCTASIEYLTRPAEVFSELARVLKPGAMLVITFSNRWFPPKAIRAWGRIHEFERIGMVLEHFITSCAFEQLHSYSLRGLPRPQDDKYAGQLPASDPVYAVWGRKS